MKKLILASLLLVNSPIVIALPTYWIDINVSSIDYKEKTSIDYTNLNGYYFNNYDKNQYYVTTWVQIDYPIAKKLANGKLYRNEKSFWYVDCNNEKIAIGETAFYTSKGSFVGQSNNYVTTYSSSNWQRAIPNSVGHGIGDAICTYYQLKMKTQQKTS